MNKQIAIGMSALTAGLLVAATGVAETSDSREGRRGRPSPADVFERIDADDSGGISQSELSDAHARRREMHEKRRGDRERPEGAPEPPTAEEIFANMDGDADGSVSLAEWEAGAAERRARRAEWHQKRKDGRGKGKPESTPGE